jgi:hypothetical protein
MKKTNGYCNKSCEGKLNLYLTHPATSAYEILTTIHTSHKQTTIKISPQFEHQNSRCEIVKQNNVDSLI